MSLKEALVQHITEVDGGETQLHLLDYFDDIDEQDQQRLAAQIRRLFLRGCVGPTAVFRDSIRLSGEPPAHIAPPRATDVTCFDRMCDKEQLELRMRGEQFIVAGKAAVIILAGGSGTRLGVSYPKGMLECPDLAQKKSLFQLICEKLTRAQIAMGVTRPVPLCIMTSPATDVATRGFFKENGYFGLLESQVFFFTQATMPCFTEDGRIVLASPSEIAEAPGGNAGVYTAFADSGLLASLSAAGVEAVQVVTVDNILARILDPAFFGLMNVKASDVVVKTTPKLHDHEAVGIFAKRSYPPAAARCIEGAAEDTTLRWGVLEYSEVGPALAAALDEHGHRLYDCANLAMHLFSVHFMRRAAEAMTQFSYYHAARKPVPTGLIDRYPPALRHSSGKSVAGVKLEAFIFDLFILVDPSPDTGAFCLMSVDRAEEFSAIKNADDPSPRSSLNAVVKKDSPHSAVVDLRALHRTWLLAALAATGNHKALQRLQSDVSLQVEVSPLVAALGPDDLASALSEDGVRTKLDAALSVDASSNGAAADHQLIISFERSGARGVHIDFWHF